MIKDLTNSSLDRQNILNNQYALEEIRKEIGFEGVLFEGEYRFLITQVSAFFEVDIRTIKRYIKRHYTELSDNGYEVLRQNRLKDYKLTLKSQCVSDINVPHKTANQNASEFRGEGLSRPVGISPRAQEFRGEKFIS